MADGKEFWLFFSKRAVLIFILCIALFFFSILRVALISTTDYSAAGIPKNGLRLTVGRPRGTIYDCNRVPLTNNKEKIIAAVSPTPRAITAMREVLSEEAYADLLERLKGGKPVLCEVPEMVECDGIICTKLYETTEIPAVHTLGYTDIDGHGVAGIQAAYDNILYSKDSISIFYESDAKGRPLEGVPPTLTNPTYSFKNGVVTTLDINIQNIVEKYAKNIERGAVVVAEAKTGKLRAVVSRPEFSVENLTQYLQSGESPLLNRAISAYNVGSIFKPCVAIAGIENNKQWFTYTCTGRCQIIDRFFNCHRRSGHGSMNLRSALAESCNTYFFNYAFLIGKDEVYKTAKTLNFGQSLKLCDSIWTAKGNLPALESLDNIAYLANLSIGQGELLLSPVSMLTLYCSIANDGKYYVPSLVEGTIQNGAYRNYDIGNPTRVMKSGTAKILRDYLQTVLTDGTGKEAKPQTVTAAGKTATAQTGKYKDGKEICQGWFCGFFPAENPQYVVIVFTEDIYSQKISCAKIFAEIADEITELTAKTKQK